MIPTSKEEMWNLGTSPEHCKDKKEATKEDTNDLNFSDILDPVCYERWDGLEAKSGDTWGNQS